MADNELKVRSIRMNDEVAEKFKAIANEFENHGAALESLISAYELQNAKAVLSERRTEVDDFDSHLQALQRAYLTSLELNENAESRIRQEFQLLLVSKDKTIRDLQEVAENEKNSRISAEETVEKVNNDLAELSAQMTSKIEQLEASIKVLEKNLQQSEQTISDKQIIIDSLNMQLAELSKSSEKISQAEQRASESERKEKQALAEKEKAEKKVEALEKTIAEQKTQHEHETELAKAKAENALERAVLEAEKTSQKRISELLNQKEKMSEKISELKEEIAALKLNLNQQDKK